MSSVTARWYDPAPGRSPGHFQDDHGGRRRQVHQAYRALPGILRGLGWRTDQSGRDGNIRI